MISDNARLSPLDYYSSQLILGTVDLCTRRLLLL